MTESHIYVGTMTGLVMILLGLLVFKEWTCRKQQREIDRLKARIIDLEGWQ